MIKPPFPLGLCIAALCVAAVAHAQARPKSPTSKLFVADTAGEAQIDTGFKIDDLSRKSVYNAQGTVIETKPASNASVVLSNGTGLYFDVDTRVQMREFYQEAFRPDRSDIEDEPSLSRTKLYIERGVVGVSTSRLEAGSTTTLETSLATASIMGRQAVVLAADNLTVVSMVQGEASVQAGPTEFPRLVKNRQQMIIRPGKTGEPNFVVIQDIPEGRGVDEEQWLEERVLTADAARRLVYFEMQALKGPDGGIRLSDGPGDPAGKEIVAIPLLPSNPTVQPNVSPASLISQ